MVGRFYDAASNYLKVLFVAVALSLQPQAHTPTRGGPGVEPAIRTLWLDGKPNEARGRACASVAS